MAVKINEDKCDGCGLCVEICPMDALKIVSEKCVCNNYSCVDCLACVPECPQIAIID